VATVGQEQLVGPYQAETSETVEVVPGSPNLNLTTENRTVGYDAVLNNDTLTFGYNDPQNETLSLTVFIHERGNKTNTLAPNNTFIDIGTATGTLTLTKEETQTEWVVKFDADRGDDEFVKRVNLFNRRALSLPIAPGWQSMLAVGSLVLLAGAFSILNAGVGAVVVSLAGGLLWFIGFLGTATSGAAIVVALFISIVGHMMSSRR